MKTKTSFAAAVILLLAASVFPAQANTFFTGKKLTIEGTISHAPGSVTPARVMPFSVANLLKAFPVSFADADPKEFRYYYDATLNAFVLAPKGTADGGDGSPSVIILDFGTGVGWEINESKSAGGGPNTGSSGLTGTYQFKRTLSGGVATSKISFIAFGTFDGLPTVLKATITYVDPDPQ